MRSPLRPFVVAFAIAVSGGLAIGLPAPAIAQPAADRVTAPPPPPKRLELTPFVAMGDDLAPGGGAAFSFDWTKNVSFEAEASLGTDATRSSLSLLYHFPQIGKFTVYAAGGAGVQRDEYEEYTGVGRVIDHKTEFAVNIGAGVTVPIGQRWAWRADFRWYNPKAEWPESWRAYYGLTLSLPR